MSAEPMVAGSIMLTHALNYAKHGYSVVQLFTGEKRPAGAWKKAQVHRATEAELTEMWREYPDANVGLVCGQVSGIIVVDVDPRNGGSVEEWTQRLPHTLSIETGSGGRHFYFRADVPVRKCQLQEGVDLQAEGSIVVAAPSRLSSGKTYRVHTDAPIAPLPEFIQNWSKRSDSPSKQLDRTWVHDLLSNGAGEGKRNDAVNRLSGYFLAKGIPADIVKPMLLDWNRTRNFPPLPDQEVVRTVDSTNRTRESNSSAWVQVAAEVLKVDYDDSNEPLSLMRLDAFMQKYGGEELRWAVDGWLPQSAIILAAALPGTYKTWVSFDLALSIATGRKFLGKYEPKTRGGVILLQHEDAFPMMAERMSVLMASHAPDMIPKEKDGVFSADVVDDKIPIYFEPARKFKLHLDDYLYSLARQIQARNIKLVVIDPLYAMIEEKDEFGKELGFLIREKLKPIRDLTGCSFLLIHHAKKSESQNVVGDRTGSWGSVFLDAASEGSWQLRRVPGKNTEIVVSPFFKSMGSSNPVKLTFDIDSECSPPKFNVASEPLTGEQADQYRNIQAGSVGEDVYNLCLDTSMSQAELADKLGKDQGQIRAAITKLMQQKRIGREGNKYRSIEMQLGMFPST